MNESSSSAIRFPGPFASLLLDCDGVMLDSNSLKTKAFRRIGLELGGPEISEALANYHRQHGGLSRFKKFTWLKTILPSLKATVEELALLYGAIVTEELAGIPETPGLRNLLEQCRRQSIPVFVVSGALETELMQTMTARGLAPYLQGIYGSPRNKMEIVETLLGQGAVQRPALFVGDSRYDCEVAAAFQFAMAFMTNYTEFEAYPQYCQEHGIEMIRDLRSLLPSPPVG